MGQEKSLPINTNPYDNYQQQKLKSKSLSGLEYTTASSNKSSASSKKSSKSSSAIHHHHHTHFRDFQRNFGFSRNYQESNSSSGFKTKKSYTPPPAPPCSVASKSSRAPSSSGYSSCYCASSVSAKSQNKQKDYLNHHLYIKSYLDILEEDIKAKEDFKPARPGIRNYKPKIYDSDTQKKKIKKNTELWI